MISQLTTKSKTIINLLVLEDFAARKDFSSENEWFIGHITGIKYVVSFHGESVFELKATLRKRLKTALNQVI